MDRKSQGERKQCSIICIYYVADQTLREPTLLIILCSNSCRCSSTSPPGQNQEDAATVAKTRGQEAPLRVSRGCRESRPFWPPENQYPPTPKSQGLDKEQRWRLKRADKDKDSLYSPLIEFHHTANGQQNAQHINNIHKSQVKTGEGHQV